MAYGLGTIKKVGSTVGGLVLRAVKTILPPWRRATVRAAGETTAAALAVSPSAFFYLGPWRWIDLDGDGDYAWHPPPGSVATIDLRSIPQMSRPGGAPEGGGLFVTNASLGSDYSLIGNAPDDNLSPRQRAALAALSGSGTVRSSRLADALWEVLTVRADPTGDTGPKPLVPDHLGNLVMHLARVAASRRLTTGLVEWSNIRELTRQDYKLIRAEDLATGSERYRRVLSWWQAKYRVPYSEFLSDGNRGDTPLPHATTITDDFNRADADPPSNSAEGWAWGEVEGSNWAIVSNQLDITGSNYAAHKLRAESDLSGTDHQVDADIEWAVANSRYGGLMARFAAAANTGYWSYTFGDRATSRILKVVAGTVSALGTVATQAPTATPTACTFSADGTTLNWVISGILDMTLTDSSITTGNRTGVNELPAGSPHVYFDNFSATDLGVTAVLRNLLLLGVGT